MVNEYREGHSPSESVLDHTTPAPAEFVLNHLVSLDDRHSVRVVVHVQQLKAGAVVEAATEVDGLTRRSRPSRSVRNSAMTSLVVSPASSWRTASVSSLVAHAQSVA